MSNDLQYVLPEIPYVLLRFHFVSEGDARLPVDKGALLRGTLGNALRKMVCIHKKFHPCKTCLVNRQCLYTRLFETLIHDEPPRFLRGLDMAPKPFVLRCGSRRCNFSSGDILKMEICLLGTAIENYPFLIAAMEQMGKRGLGRERTVFRLQLVESPLNGDYKPLYQDEKILRKPLTATTAESLLPENANHLEMQLLTPLRIMIDKKPQRQFTFRQLVFKVLRRHLELAHFYVPEAEIEWEFHHLLVAADDISINYETEWKNNERYSGRQKKVHPFGGLTGTLQLNGPLQPFLPLLGAAQILNVGKGATFGLGRVEIKSKIIDNTQGKESYAEFHTST